jgi:hypothetical protein
MLLSAIQKKKPMADIVIKNPKQNINTNQITNTTNTSNTEPVILFISSQDIDDTDTAKTKFESNDPPPTIMTVRVDLSKFNLNVESTNLGIFMTRYFFDCIWRDSLLPSDNINSNSGMSTSKKIYLTFYIGTTNQRLIKPQTNLIGKIDADYVIIRNGLLISENASYPYSTVFSTNTDSYFENQFTSQQEYFGESGIFIGYADKNGLRALKEQQVITVKMVTERTDNYNSPFWYSKFLQGVSIWNESNKIWEIDEPNSERQTFYNKVSIITTSQIGGPYMPLSLYTLEKPILNSVASFIIKNNLSNVKAKISGRTDILKGDNVKLWISQIGLKNSTTLNDISINTRVLAKDDSTSYSVDLFDYNIQGLVTEEIISIQKGKDIFTESDNISRHYTLGSDSCRNIPFYFPNGEWKGEEISTTSGHLFPFEKDLDDVVKKIINEEEDYDDSYSNIIIKEDNYLFMDSGSKWEQFGDDSNITLGERSLQFDFGNECYVNMIQLIFPKSKEDHQPYEINASLNKTFDGSSKSYVSVRNPLYFSGYQHTKPSGSKSNTDYGKGYKYLNTHTQTTNSLYGCNMPLYNVTNRSLSGTTDFSNININIEDPSYIQDYTKPTYTELSDGTKAININSLSGSTYSIDTQLSSLNEYSFWTLELKVLFSATFNNEIPSVIFTTPEATLSIDENNFLSLAIGSDYYASSVSPITEDQWTIIGIQYDYRDKTIKLYHNGSFLFTIDYISASLSAKDVFDTIILGSQTNINTMYFNKMRISYILRYPNQNQYSTDLENDIYTLNIEPWLQDKMKYIVNMSGDSFIHTKAMPNDINPAYDFTRQEIGPFVKGACIEDVLDTSIYKAISSTAGSDWEFIESPNSYYFQDLVTFLSSAAGIDSIGGLAFYSKVSSDEIYYRITSAREAYFLDPDYIEEICVFNNNLVNDEFLNNSTVSSLSGSGFVLYTLTEPIYTWIMKNFYIYLLDGDPTDSTQTVSPVKEYIVKETFFFSPSYNQYDKDHTTTVGGNSNVLQPSETYNPQKMVIPEFSVGRYFGLSFGSFLGSDNYSHTRGPLNRARLYGLKLFTQYFDFTALESGNVSSSESTKPATFNVNVSRGGIISCNVVDSGKGFNDTTYTVSPYTSVNSEGDSYYDGTTKTWIDRVFYFDESQDYLGGYYNNTRPDIIATTTTDETNVKSYFKGSNKNPLKRSAEFTLRIKEIISTK